MDTITELLLQSVWPVAASWRTQTQPWVLPADRNELNTKAIWMQIQQLRASACILDRLERLLFHYGPTAEQGFVMLN
jgi:hypothetical protein